MNAKKFTLTFLLLFIVSYALLYLLYVMVNPEQIYNGSITEKKFFYTKAYSRKQYEALKKKKYVLVFGTSQIHRISSKMLGKDLLNMHNIYGVPVDINNFLDQLDTKQISHIEEIFYLIDLSARTTSADKKIIDYKNPSYDFHPLNMEKLKRLWIDINNNSTSYQAFLNIDGSVEHVNPKEHVKMLPHEYFTHGLKYNNNLIKGILRVNQFAEEHHIKITFFTPVMSETHFKTLDLATLKPFFSKLLDGGIQSIGLYYFIPGLSDLKNKHGEPISFMDENHLNQYYVDIWFKRYVLTDNNTYTVHNQKELETYIGKMLKKQEILK
ncbi:hypothetical protein [Sulfurovum sp. NBC37-1]|uniref:hypothetical protein n=1 Tax=Sulfurovum sp. (strain NBC37-1) TaxID=387093 RepID=UPI0001587B5F|nr:hypothetical protein [Sulfurovum sp. NBC37-1]BAF72484.1 hypothetical protein SUN_1533 [Sulfurovum sp. NBC37-1]